MEKLDRLENNKTLELVSCLIYARAVTAHPYST